jgi:hypothetical protein
VQQSFSKPSLFKGLFLAGLVVSAHAGLGFLPDRVPAAPARAAIQFEPAAIDAASLAPFRLVGAWRVTSSEPRMGGISALAFDRELVALSDSGVVIRFAPPGARVGIGTFQDLPAGPGSAFQKSGRDSESLTRDLAGRGWWIGFENRQSAWLFSSDFRKALQRVDLGQLGWPPNNGAEGAVSTSHGLWVFPEGGGEVVRIGEGERVVIPVEPGVAAGEPVRVAVRPERVRIGASGDAAPEGGSRLEGTIGEIVYLGMYTQFHVETRAGRVVSHRLADEVLAPLEVGSRIVLSWAPEHTAVLGDPIPADGL